MLKQTQRLLMGLMILLGVALSPGLASAQSFQGCVVPNYVPGQTVYVASDLANDPQFPLTLKGLSSDLAPVAANHKLAVFVIACQANYQPGAAVPLANDAIAKWSQIPSFPKSNALIVVFIRKLGDPNHLSIAGVGGSVLQDYGLGPQYMGDHDNGPFATADLRRDLNDPAGMILHVVQRIDAKMTDVDNAKIEAARQAEQAREQAIIDAQNAAARAHVMKIVFIDAPFGIFAVVMLVLFFLSRGKSGSLLADCDDKFAKANQRYVDIQGKYFGFFSVQGPDWKKKFSGATLTAYTAAVGQFADLTALFAVAKDRIADARRKAAINVVLGGIAGLVFLGSLVGAFVVTGTTLVVGFLAVGAWATLSYLSARKAVALLTTENCEITGQALPTEMVSLFGDDVTKASKPLPQVLADMESLYASAVQKAAKIVAAFQGAQTNKEAIQAEVGEIDAAKQSLTDNGLSFDPYQTRYDAVASELQAFLAILAADPMTAFQSSQTTKQHADALKGDIDKAIEIKKSLAAVQTEITKSTTRAATVRGTAAGYAYPDGDAPAGAAVNFTLKGECDPDPIIAKANEELATAGKQILAGDLVNSVASAQAATESAQEAYALIESVLAAKAAVEKAVPKASANLKQLDSERPAGAQDLAAIKADFIPGNFNLVAGNVATADKVSASTAGVLATIKAAYFEQRYLTAQKTVSELGSDIQGARDGIVALHARLGELRGLRAHAKATVQAADELSGTLAGKLHDNDFTTSEATGRLYKDQQPKLVAQKADVAKSITDWVAAAAASDTLLGSLKQVDSNIDTEKAAHDLATRRIGELASAIRSAAATVTENDDTRDPARSKFSEAQSALRQAQTAVAVAKSDWNSIARDAESHTGLVGEAVRLAQADQQVAADARAAIQRASEKIRSVEGASYSEGRSIGGSYSTFGSNVSADCSNASGHLRSARSYLSSRQYENARDEANNAFNSAEAAREEAVRETAALIAAAVAAYEAEQERLRREREAEEERRREAERAEQRRRDEENNRSSGGGFGGGNDFGGGNAGGGGVSGGNAGGNDL